MNKNTLQRTVAIKTARSQKAVTQTIMDSMVSGEKLAILGFGTFKSRQRQKTQRRNPQTGETMLIPATQISDFSPGKPFKEKVAK